MDQLEWNSRGNKRYPIEKGTWTRFLHSWILNNLLKTDNAIETILDHKKGINLPVSLYKASKILIIKLYHDSF